MSGCWLRGQQQALTFKGARVGECVAPALVFLGDAFLSRRLLRNAMFS